MIIELQSSNSFLYTLLIPLRCTRHRNDFSLLIEGDQIHIVIVNRIKQITCLRLLTLVSKC
ncbi:hypothetical protein AXW98_11560 [Pseudomonas aeruginosa]|nr:hypothetical protein AXW98_11560 [Pseudomonas aeruginosa]